jgi:hypothetical protein
MGNEYSLVFTDSLENGDRGDCDPPGTSKAKIRIRKGLSQAETLEVIIHELLHAANWHMSEEWVTETAQDISKVLTRLGYKRANPPASRQPG